MTAEEKLKELGLELPPAPKSIGVYKPAVTTGNLVLTSGHGPLQADGTLIKGVIGVDADQQAGYEAAKLTGLALLATLKEHLGSLDRIKRVIKLTGFVACTADFDQQAAVINGCSEVFRDVLGEDKGVGARSAVGMVALPVKMLVEIEGIFEIE